MSEARTLGARSEAAAASAAERMEQIGTVSLFAMAASVQFSIAVAQSTLALAVICWAGTLLARRERVTAPRFFWPLAAYAGITLVSAAFSTNPRIGFLDSKQLALFLLVPVSYRFATRARASTILTIVMSLGAASAAFGIFQWALLHYDQLGQRPQGTLGHYMTYSGLLMLVIGIALARLLFSKHERLWAALVMPALFVAMGITLSRNAWVGAFAAAAVLLALKDLRLMAALPLVVALTVGVAGSAVNARFFSMFDPNDVTRVERQAMLREGVRMIRAHPLVGVGPNMVKELYAEYRVPGGGDRVNPHLHNVPVQIAAERGIPALLLWMAFMGLLLKDLASSFRLDRDPVLAATAIAAVVGMLAGGLFEYNFGDSEFLMLFLMLVTLPFAAERLPDGGPAAPAARGARFV